MSMVHNVYVGHFQLRDGFVVIHQGSFTCNNPIDCSIVEALLTQYSVTRLELETEWGILISTDTMMGNRAGCVQALSFLADYARRSGASIVDMGSFMMLTPSELGCASTQQLTSHTGAA